MAIVAGGVDTAALQSAFQDAGWPLAVADNTTDALMMQMEQRFCVILLQREAAGRDWRPAVRVLSRMAPRPCVLLLSQTPDMNLWEELVRCGGFDVVRVPLDGGAMIRTVRAGWSVWKQQPGAATRQWNH